jgi:prophage regulatory protein
MESQPQFIRLPEVLRIVGLSKSEIWRRIQAGTFPAPIKLGDRATRFELSEVHAWASARLAERPSPRLIRADNASA